MDVQVVDLFNGCGGMSQGFAQAQCDAVTFELAGAMDTDRLDLRSHLWPCSVGGGRLLLPGRRCAECPRRK